MEENSLGEDILILLDDGTFTPEFKSLLVNSFLHKAYRAKDEHQKKLSFELLFELMLSSSTETVVGYAHRLRKGPLGHGRLKPGVSLWVRYPEKRSGNLSRW